MQALPPSPRPTAALPAPAGPAAATGQGAPIGQGAPTEPAAGSVTGSASSEPVSAEPTGLIPAPRNAPVGGWQPRFVPSARSRARTPVALDAVVFTAPCPGCGNDCEWLEQREDTRLRAQVHCSCVPA